LTDNYNICFVKVELLFGQSHFFVTLTTGIMTDIIPTNYAIKLL